MVVPVSVPVPEGAAGAPQPRPLPLADNPSFGLVNPNPEPMTVVGTVIPFGFLGLDGGIAEFYQDLPETFTKTVPAYGWLQFRWEATAEHLQGGDFQTILSAVSAVSARSAVQTTWEHDIGRGSGSGSTCGFRLRAPHFAVTRRRDKSGRGSVWTTASLPHCPLPLSAAALLVD